MVNSWRAALAELFGLSDPLHDPEGIPFREALEARLSARLPDALFEFLNRVAAKPERQATFGQFRWLRSGEIEPTWKLQTQLARHEEEVDKKIAGEWDDRVLLVTHHRQRVPIAEFNGDVWIYLDFIPTTSGTVGQVIQVDAEGLNWFWLARSIDEFLIHLANGLVLDPDAGTQE